MSESAEHDDPSNLSSTNGSRRSFIEIINLAAEMTAQMHSSVDKAQRAAVQHSWMEWLCYQNAGTSSARAVRRAGLITALSSISDVSLCQRVIMLQYSKATSLEREFYFRMVQSTFDSEHFSALLANLEKLNVEHPPAESGRNIFQEKDSHAAINQSLTRGLDLHYDENSDQPRRSRVRDNSSRQRAPFSSISKARHLLMLAATASALLIISMNNMNLQWPFHTAPQNAVAIKISPESPSISVSIHQEFTLVDLPKVMTLGPSNTEGLPEIHTGDHYNLEEIQKQMQMINGSSRALLIGLSGSNVIPIAYRTEGKIDFDEQFSDNPIVSPGGTYLTYVLLSFDQECPSLKNIAVETLFNAILPLLRTRINVDDAGEHIRGAVTNFGHCHIRKLDIWRCRQIYAPR
jgi:hypothetical protein